jgi:hypothetical protein
VPVHFRLGWGIGRCMFNSENGAATRDDTWVITSYFNPYRYRTRRENFELFATSLQEICANAFVVELATDGGTFELPEPKHGLRIKSGSSLWQKERMLNLAIERLPADCTKVVWLDCDLIFEDGSWLASVSKALETYSVIQPFSECIRLEQGETPQTAAIPYPEGAESFARAYARNPDLSRTAPFAIHGHTGFAWAARRDVLARVGLYDACLTGSGDHLMAHVFAGALQSPCIAAMIGEGHAYALHFRHWAEKMHTQCAGNLGYVEGRLFHLWHGDEKNRRYRNHNTSFRSFDFDPARDIMIGSEGLWEWTESAGAMKDWAEEMLRSRKEDG